MRLFVGKKGIDYAAMMVLVTFVAVSYLYIQLAAKLEPFQVKIGENQVALLNAYQRGEDALLYLDQAASMSAYQAMHTLAMQGGMAEKPCGQVTDDSQTVNAWTMNGTACFDAVQPYDAYAQMLNSKLNAYIDLYNLKHENERLPLDNYEIFVQQNTVTGTAIAPARIWLQPPPEVRKFYVTIIKVAEAELKKAAIGEYAFKPSFTVKAETKLDFYDTLKREAGEIYKCIDAGNAKDDCLNKFKLTVKDSSLKQVGDNVVVRVKNPVKNPYDKKELPEITFALYLP